MCPQQRVPRVSAEVAKKWRDRFSQRYHLEVIGKMNQNHRASVVGRGPRSKNSEHSLINHPHLETRFGAITHLGRQISIAQSSSVAKCTKRKYAKYCFRICQKGQKYAKFFS